MAAVAGQEYPQSSGLAACGLHITGPGGLGGEGGLGGLGGPGFGHRHAALPHCGHFSPPGQSCFGSFGLQLIGPAASVVSIRRWVLPPPLLLLMVLALSPSVISHSMLVRLPFVPTGWGRVVTVTPVTAMLLHTFFLASAELKLPSVDHSVPLDFTVLASSSALAVDLPSLQVVVAGSPGSGPSGTEGGGPGAAPTAVTRHFHLNGKPTGIWAAPPCSPPPAAPPLSSAAATTFAR